MNAEQMVECALGTLEEWLPGYTHPEDRPQERLRQLDSDDPYSIVIEAESLDPIFGDGTRTFRITVKVEELEP